MRSGYVTQFYDGKPDAASADAVTIVSAGTVSGIDFALSLVPPPPTYTITGFVRDASGNPIGGALVQAEMLNSPIRNNFV